MKKALWLASVVGLAVAGWATLASVPAQADGSYAAQQSVENGDLARRGGGSSGGSSYGSSGGGRRQRGGDNYGSSGGGRRHGGRGHHGSYGSHG
ncbi:MAG: hypothetical protein ACK5Q5_21880 [Planctomycetaceae bacterium]